MKSLYKSIPVEILNIQNLNYNTKLFTLAVKWIFQPGQFVMAGIPGIGEGAFSIPAKNQLAIRKVGALTDFLHKLEAGDKIYVRGPYGKQGWPLKDEKKLKTEEEINNSSYEQHSAEDCLHCNLSCPSRALWGENMSYTESKEKVLIVAGGCGIIALRPLLDEKEVIIFYGVRSEKDLLFKSEYQNWSNFNIAMEPEMITDLFAKVQLPKISKAFLCGPPMMYKFVIEKLKNIGLEPQNIYVSLERRMHCGTGVCQHCAIGKKYVCKDGPVFRLDELEGEPF